MRRYGVIMAGGGGNRFWPLSRRECPKQLLNLSGKELMINETIDRLSQSIEKNDIFIVTNVSQEEKMREVTKERILSGHILSEPAARNTAACIGYAAMEIVTKYEDGIMCIVPSDAFIKGTKEFARVIEASIKVAEEKDALVTIGIKPTFPATGYGYIKRRKGTGEAISESSGRHYYEVDEFVEKPDVETADQYVKDGNYLWNSGMFVWKASTILKKFEELLPDVYDCLLQMQDAMGMPGEEEALCEIYPRIPKISIDYGIMERAKEILVLEGDFGWNDIGSLDMLTLTKEADENGNVVFGKQIHLDTKNCISYGTSQLITTIGVENLIIVQTDDAILICDKDKAQSVKELVELMEAKGMQEYL